MLGEFLHNRLRRYRVLPALVCTGLAVTLSLLSTAIYSQDAPPRDDMISPLETPQPLSRLEKR